VRGVRAAWVAHDLRTIDNLERLDTATAWQLGMKRRAEAFYQLASHLYEADPLTFYNPAAWQGQRYHTITDAHRPSSYRAPGEVQILSNYLGEHSTRARALNLYLQIARDYPHTRAAPDALYTAAVCHDRDNSSGATLINLCQPKGARSNLRRRAPRLSTLSTATRHVRVGTHDAHGERQKRLVAEA
jgi:hypothetical protein